jgi:hypothetical protein
MVHLAAAVIDLSIIAQVWPLDGTDTTISFQEQKIMLEFGNETHHLQSSGIYSPHRLAAWSAKLGCL